MKKFKMYKFKYKTLKRICRIILCSFLLLYWIYSLFYFSYIDHFHIRNIPWYGYITLAWCFLLAATCGAGQCMLFGYIFFKLDIDK